MPVTVSCLLGMNKYILKTRASLKLERYYRIYFGKQNQL